jgi:RluA family pseudouridine synthase
MMIKLASYLKKKYPGLSSRVLKRALEQGACLVNGKIERFASRLIDPNKDKIEYKDLRPKSKDKLSIKAERIIFEDEHMLVYNKEAGYPSLNTESKKHPHLHGELIKFLAQRDHGIEDFTLIDEQFHQSRISNKEVLIKQNPLRKLFLQPVHRLDKNTSGLMIFAKTETALHKLSEMFKEKSIYKEYEAIVDGSLSKKPSGKIETWLQQLKKKGASQKWQAVNKKSAGAKYACTNYQLIKAYKPERSEEAALLGHNNSVYTHVKLVPETGRTHQLRVHMAYIGHPILGDTVYAENFTSGVIVDRHFLHASKLAFKHPISDQELKLWAATPKDMMDLLI